MVVFSTVCESDSLAYREYLRTLLVVELVRHVGSTPSAITDDLPGVVSRGLRAVGGGDESVEVARLDDRIKGAVVEAVAGIFGKNGERGGQTTGCVVGVSESCVDGRSGECGDAVDGTRRSGLHSDVEEGVIDAPGGVAEVIPEWRRRGASFSLGGPAASDKTLRNRARRKEKKELKQRRQAKGVDVRFGVPKELSESWVARKNAENKLAALKAEKDLEYQMKRDVEAEARKSRARILKATEQDKVAVEKAFSTLKSTGNVPGYCETVLTKEPSLTEGETISPDSSISQAEIRAMHKENLDLKEKLKKKDRQIAFLQFENGDECAFTINDEGTINDSVKEELGKFEKYGWLWEYSGDDSYGQDRAYTAFVRRKCVDRGDSAFY